MATVTTTLHLHPTNTDLSAIEFDTNLTTPNDGYAVNLGSLRLNERDRIKVAYSEGADLNGGDIASYRGQMVPITFDVIVSDTSKAELLDRVHALEAILLDDQGGVLEYRPDGLSGSVMATYYTYLRSAPPTLKQMKGNTWDAPAHNGVYRAVLEVELMTWPLASSNPASPVAVKTSTTVYNVGDGSQDFLTVSAANIKGTLPALARIKVTPGSDIKRLWIAQRTKGIGTFEPTYVAGSSLGAYTTSQADTGRCGGSYWRTQDPYGAGQAAVRFTVSNWSYQEGRAALALVCRANCDYVDDIEVWFQASINSNVVAVGERMNVHTIDTWLVCLLGEIDVPEIELGSVGTGDLDIDIYVQSVGVNKATITFDTDALKLLYTDEGAIQAEPIADYFQSNAYCLLENLTGEEVALHVQTSNSDVLGVANAFGHFITLKPGVDNRLDFIWECYLSADLHDPTDTASVTVDAIFRTVTPFSEA